MIRMPTALAVIGAIVIILGTWMMINETTTGLQTVIAGIAIELLAIIMVLFRMARKRKP